MRNDNIRWPAFITCLVLAFVAFSWWTMDRAASGVSPVSDPNYYSHGLKYNNTNIEIQTAQALSWKITPKVKGRALTIQLVDAKEIGIDGVTASIIVQPDDVEHRPFPALPLIGSGQGLYSVTFPASLPPTFSASLTLSKEQATVQRQLLMNLE